MDIHASLSPTNYMNAVKCATCSSSMWAGWSKFGGSHQTESLVSFCFSVYWEKKVCARKTEDKLKNPKLQQKKCTRMPLRDCVTCKQEVKTEQWHRTKASAFLCLFFDAQIRRQEFRFLLENIGGSSQARKENKHVGRMKQLLSTQKQQMPFLDRKCGFCEKEVYDMFEGH